MGTEARDRIACGAWRVAPAGWPVWAMLAILLVVALVASAGCRTEQADADEQRTARAGQEPGAAGTAGVRAGRMREFSVTAYCTGTITQSGARVKAGMAAADPGPHRYLMILGVDPPYQGRGVGGELLRPTLARADTAGLPCYLETAKERNLTFYRRHGFEVAEQHAAGEGGPRCG